MNNNSSAKSGGIGFVGLLTIVFIALKLTGFIAWPWVWVLSPIWIIVLIWILIIVIAGFVFAIKEVRQKSKEEVIKQRRDAVIKVMQDMKDKE